MKHSTLCSIAFALTIAATRVDALNAGSSVQSRPPPSTRTNTNICSTSISGEPAGVTTIFLGKRERMKDTVRSVVSFLRPRHRSREIGHEQVVDDDQLSEVNLPEWACKDPEEKSRLAKMKFLLRNEFVGLSKKKVFLDEVGSARVVQAFPDVYSDFRLLRYLRKDKVQDPASAAKRYRRFLKWRDEYDVDRIRAMVENSPFCPPNALMEVNRFIPCDFGHSERSEGEATLMLLHVGDWDTAGITTQIKSGAISMDEFLTYWAFMFESLTKKLHENAMERKEMLYVEQICDLTTLSLQQLSPSFVSRVMKPWISLTQNNYPETTKRIIFFHPPRILSIIWGLVTPFVSPGTVAKVELQRNFKGTGEEFMRSESVAH